MSPTFYGTTFADIHSDLYKVIDMDRKLSERVNTILILCKEQNFNHWQRFKSELHLLSRIS